MRAPYMAGLALAVALGNSACQRQADAPAAPAAAGPADSGSDELVLNEDQLQHLGVQLKVMTATTHAADIIGYGAVLSRVTLAAAITEAAAAHSAAEQTHAALQRAQALASTAGAFSVDAQQSIERQASADVATAELADGRLEALMGRPAIDTAQRQQLQQQLSHGDVQLVRVTFPLQSLSSGLPSRLQIEALDSSIRRSSPAQRIWSAPSDPAFPGRSVYAALRSGAFEDGERVLARTPQGPSQNGVIIPAAAVVIYDAHYWCYVQGQPNHFRRVQLSADAPTNDGYFVSDGVHAGDTVVTQAAALLLSQQTGTGDDAD